MTTYRESCGTHFGMRMHQEHDEEPCGQCLIGEAGRRLYSELIPTRPSPRPTGVAEISEAQAQRNLADWFDAIDGPPTALRRVV